MFWLLIRSERKKRNICQQIRALPAWRALLAQDETDLLLFPPLRSGWARLGEPAPVLISGQNARRIVFGALNLQTGHPLFLDQKRRRIEEFEEFLDLLHQQYRGRPLALLLDENSIHTAEQSRSLAEDLDIQLLWLPKRSPHLNPMDHLWRHGKAVICANRQHATLDEQVDQFIAYFQRLSPTKLLRKAGVLSKSFWLPVRH